MSPLYYDLRPLGMLWVIVLLMAACGSAAVTSADASKVRKQLDEHLKRCTEVHGFDPEAASDLGPHTLGAGEREWRECVYQGVEKHVIPRALVPEAYRQAIAQDREMTESVVAGRMTRAERRERIQVLLAEIDRREDAEAQRVIKDVLRREQEMMLMRDHRSMIRPLGR